MKIRKIIFLLIIIIILTSCQQASVQIYEKISAKDAKNLLEEDSEILLLDVRAKEEYDSGHVPGSILLPHDKIEQGIEEITSDKKMIIIVYCKSGGRSETASDTLVRLGYKEVYNMGAITDWPYEITDKEE